MPPRALWKTSVPNPSSNQRRVPVLRGPAYDDGGEGVRVKPVFETLAPRSLAQAQIVPLYPWERIYLPIESLNDGILAG